MRWSILIAFCCLLSAEEYLLLGDGAFHHDWDPRDSSEAVQVDGAWRIRFEQQRSCTLELPAGKKIDLNNHGMLRLQIETGDSFGDAPIICSWFDDRDRESALVAIDGLQPGSSSTRYLPQTAFRGNGFDPARVRKFRLTTKLYEDAHPFSITHISLLYPIDVMGEPKPVGISLESYTLKKTAPTLALQGSKECVGNGNPVCPDRPEETWTSVPVILDGAATLAPARDDKLQKAHDDAYRLQLEQDTTVFAIIGGQTTKKWELLPRWIALQGWRRLSLKLGSNRKELDPWLLYAKHVPAGSLTLANNTVGEKNVVYCFLPGHVDLNMLDSNKLELGKRVSWIHLLNYRGQVRKPELRPRFRKGEPSNLDREEYWEDVPEILLDSPVLICARDDKLQQRDPRMYQMQVDRPCTVFVLVDQKKSKSGREWLHSDGWQACGLSPRNNKLRFACFYKHVEQAGPIFLGNHEGRDNQNVCYVFRPDLWNPSLNSSRGNAAYKQIRLSLVDTRDDEELGPLENADRIEQEKNNPTPFNILADVDDSVKSMVFKLEGPLAVDHIENTAPFSLFGKDGDRLQSRAFHPGSYRLTVTPFAEADAKGTAGTARVVHFTIDDGSPVDLAARLPPKDTAITENSQPKPEQQPDHGKPAETPEAQHQPEPIIVIVPFYRRPLVLIGSGALIGLFIVGLILLNARKDARAFDRLTEGKVSKRKNGSRSSQGGLRRRSGSSQGKLRRRGPGSKSGSDNR